MKNLQQKKNIIIDGSNLKQVRGVGSYVNSLISGIDKINISKKFNIIVILPVNYKENLKHFKNIKFIKRPFINKIIWDLVLFPLYGWIARGSLIHCTENTSGSFLSNLLNLKLIVTVHDVSFLKNFDVVGKPISIKQWIGLYYRRWNISKSIKYSKNIITVSKFARKDIAKELKISKKKIKITYNSLSKKFFLIRKISQKKNNILIVTGPSNQKNFSNTIKYLEDSKDIIKGWKVIVVGIKGTDTKLIKYIGNVSRENLLKYYDRSKILIMPSLYESFSIPIIEGLSRELFVISSKFGAAPEILNKYGLLYNPKSIKELRKSLTLVIKNKKYFNNYKIKKAKKYALTFNQERLAKKTLKIYEEELK